MHSHRPVGKLRGVEGCKITHALHTSSYLTLEDAIYTAKLLDSLGVAAIEISGGIKESKKGFAWPGINAPEKEAYLPLPPGKLKLK